MRCLVLQKPARSKCTWTFHKSYFVWKSARKVPYANPATPVLCEPAQSKCVRTFHKSHFVWICFVRACAAEMHMDVSQEPFCVGIYKKSALRQARDTFVLCEPAQSKCTWTCHKRHFVGKFTGKMPNASDTTSIEHRPLTITVRTPQCGHTVWEICFKKNIDDALLGGHRGVWKLVPGKPKYWLMLMNHYILILNGCLLRHAQISNTHVESCCPPPTRKPAAQSPWRWSEVRRIPCRSALGAWKAPQTAPPAPAGSDQHSHCSNSTVYRIL